MNHSWMARRKWYLENNTDSIIIFYLPKYLWPVNNTLLIFSLVSMFSALKMMLCLLKSGGWFFHNHLKLFPLSESSGFHNLMILVSHCKKNSPEPQAMVRKIQTSIYQNGYLAVKRPCLKWIANWINKYANFYLFASSLGIK